ncbi:fumarylacetoacetate hydrolase family protein [Brevibacillus humidisoli]|uniref:fumarylacetoacetate hydrolase family protein n=1 Tax=Brevibacillus humidisoli TaxID=2895522 RepID=UPI001E32AF04|nr:fumarylacetoacetate hydrolase family protein [Brevibacillus humidisoli]UFJ41632.1 fumarylacetoacetate hydrolase family protein [Brevibacillus humidisoli]
MKLVTYKYKEKAATPWRAGLLVERGVLDIGEQLSGAPEHLLGLLEQWQRWRDPLHRLAGQQGVEALPLEQLLLGPPLLRPRSFRDFYAFEEHVKTARGRRGLEMVPEWYHFPVFYFSNAAAFVGPEAEVVRPRATRWLDYELEIACVIGKEGVDIPVDEADRHIAGFCVLNDWSARDLQREEVKVGLGPAKGKDFATSLGPYLVTPDELEDRRVDGERGARYDLTMTAKVNGKEYSRGNFRDIYYTFAEMIARASADCTLYPGDVIGSGTVGTGCILELGGDYPWLEPGDVVELEVERLGVLRNRIAEKRV